MTKSLVSRRCFNQGLLAAGTALAAPAVIPGASAAEAKELRILFPRGTWKDWFEQVWVAPFPERTGTQAIRKTGLGFEPLGIAQRRQPHRELIHAHPNP